MGGPGSGRKTNQTQARDRAMVALRKRGLTLAAIGALFGVTPQCVAVAVRRAGYAGNPTGLGRPRRKT
jgi:hypothetical protein